MRIAEAEMLLTKYSKENERLAGQNVELRQRRQYLDQDYTGQLCLLLPLLFLPTFRASAAVTAADVGQPASLGLVRQLARSSRLSMT